ncbi:MAG: hypothetical protein KDD56_08725, partial [Bdellovibrionales bacterium]|nr:hypothetical protein [Bdellovibrionales bacterium]
TLRRALQQIPADQDLAGLFLFCVVDNQEPYFLLQEAKAIAEICYDKQHSSKIYETAVALYKYYFEDEHAGYLELEKIITAKQVPLDAIIAFAEILLSLEKTAEANAVLHKGLKSEPNSPRILTLLAQTYLQDDSLKNPDYAVQLALSACQNSNWLSPRELHVLAEAYAEKGDIMSALIAANKAKQEGERLLGNYRHSQSLSKLISYLSHTSR